MISLAKKIIFTIILYSISFTSFAQSLSDWNHVPVTADNNQTVIIEFSSTNLIGYEVKAFATKYEYSSPADQYNGVGPSSVSTIPVSTSVLIEASEWGESSAITGLAVMGQDNMCNSIGASNGDLISFYININGILVKINNEINYSAHGIVSINTANGFSVNGEDILLGCTDALFLEHNISANLDDGSCSTYKIPGCTINYALNYDANANSNDGSCLVEGCKDPSAINYDEYATIDDSTCIFHYPITSPINNGWNMVGFTNKDPLDITSYLTENGLINSFDIIKDITGNFWTPDVELLNTFEPGQGYLMYNRTGNSFAIQFSEKFHTEIESRLNSGWNMIGFTNIDPLDITSYLTENGLINSFDIIKDITGDFWTPDVELLNTFEPGQGYLMYNHTGNFIYVNFTD